MGKYNLTSRKLIRILERNGFVFVRQNGSHALFKKHSCGRKVIVPIHARDLPVGTVKAILDDAGIL